MEFKIPLWKRLLYIFVIVLFFTVLGYFIFGKQFFLKTLYGSLLLPTIILIFEVLKFDSRILFEIEKQYFEAMNPLSEIILSVILGSVLTGFGLGFCFKNDASTG